MGFSGYLCPLSIRRIQDEPHLACRHEMAAPQVSPPSFRLCLPLMLPRTKRELLTPQSPGKITMVIKYIASSFQQIWNEALILLKFLITVCGKEYPMDMTDWQRY